MEERYTVTNPLISIITVVFNGASTLEHTIHSVINQTYRNIEYIIIDGASTDGTVDIIKRYAGKLSHWVSEPDQGIYDAMNKGLRVARGDWAYFLGSDDLLATPATIEELTHEFQDLDKVYYGNVFLKNRQQTYGKKFTKLKLSLGNFPHQAVFYPKRIYKNKEYNLKYKIMADHVYNIELYTLYQASFAYISKLVAIYNDLGLSNTHRQIDSAYAKEIVSIVFRNFGCIYGMHLWLRRKLKLGSLHSKLRKICNSFR